MDFPSDEDMYTIIHRHCSLSFAVRGEKSQSIEMIFLVWRS